MSTPGSLNELMIGSANASAAAYQVARSLRARSASSTYMNRTPGAAGNQQKGTFSFWAKRTRLGTFDPVLCATGNHSYIGFSQSGVAGLGTDKFGLSCNGSGNVWSIGVYRDVTAWAHFVCAWDTTQTVGVNRVRLYVNGAEVAYDSSSAYPTQNTNIDICGANAHNLWRYVTGAYQADIQLAQIALVDGQQLTPSTFGTTDATTNQWIPKDLSSGITWGTTGFWLKLTDNSSVANLGTDSSGNSNTWTVNNFSVTAGTTNDSLTDTPTNYGTDTGAGGEVRGNYCVINPIDANGNTLARGNLGLDGAVNNKGSRGSFGMSTGKWVWEFTRGDTDGSSAINVMCGIILQNQAEDATFYNSSNCYLYASWDGFKYYNGGSSAAFGATWRTAGDVIRMEFDADAGTLQFFKNNSSQGTITSIAAGTWVPYFGRTGGTTSMTNDLNFGQRPFANTATSGFKALCTQNLATPAIAIGANHFNAYTYTGNGGNQFIGDPVPQPIDSYQFTNGLRFQSANSTKMTKTFGAAATNAQKWTTSVWVKRSKLGAQQRIFAGAISGATTELSFTAGDVIYCQICANGAASYYIQTNQVFRDTQNWHHFVVAYDCTQATASNRWRLYYDGVEITSFSTDQRSSLSTSNAHTGWLDNTYLSEIGDYISGSYFDGYMAQFAAVDGQQLTPSTFGTTDANGNWIPKDLSSGITWGTNGFWLPFTNVSTTATLGNDSSGNSNTFTTSGFSVTAGTGYDPLTDCPASYGSDTGAGGEMHSNYPTWDSDIRTSATYTEGNLFISANGTNGPFFATQPLPTTGKWYWEITAVSLGGAANAYPGMVAGAQKNTVTSAPQESWHYNKSGVVAGYLYGGTSWTGGTYTSYTDGDIIGFAYDADTGRVWCSKNGTWQNSGAPASGTGYVAVLPAASTPEGYYPAVAWGAITQTWRFNFGQRAFNTAAPSGFKSLCTTNMPVDSQIVSTPDIAWIKTRNTTSNWVQADSTRGVGLYLSSNLTSAETTDVNSVQGFTYNGIYIGNATVLNTLNNTYVAYLWNKSATCGVDIATYSGTGSAKTVNHSLGVVPAMMVVKGRSGASGGAQNWRVYHKMLNGGTTPQNYVIYLSATSASAADSTVWNNTAPTSSVFTVGTDSGVNNSDGTYVAYLFAEVAGFSKFGIYTGNGASDGPFVYCGFRPRLVICKRTDSTGSWIVTDAARSPNNQTAANVVFETTAAEVTAGSSWGLDFLSNGFKLRDTGPQINASGGTYIFAAFAESPFNYSRAR